MHAVVESDDRLIERTSWDTPPVDERPRATGRVEIDVLGPLAVRQYGREILIRRGRPRVLVASLVLARGQAVSAHALIDRLWGEQLPVNPANALQSQIAYVRRVLGGLAGAPIHTGPDGYTLDSAGVAIDIDRFEASLAAARPLAAAPNAASLVAAEGHFSDALALWRGAPFADVAGTDVADVEIVRLEEMRLAAEEGRGETLLALGRTAEAIAALTAMVREHPLRERRQELYVLALYRDGRQADALRALSRARRTLADELGVDPGSALRELEQAVLTQDRRLDWKPPDHDELGGADRVAVATVLPDAMIDQRVRPALDGPAGRRQCLIGRGRELARIVELIEEHKFVTLTGPGGAGKTRLALAAAELQSSRRVHVVDLAAADSPGAVERAIADVIGVKSAVGDVTPSLVTALRGAGVLLVLDTCERVLDGVARCVERLLAAVSDLVVLATSRRPVGVAGELAWPVPPLGVPGPDGDPRTAASFELFMQRTHEVAPDFTPDEPDLEAIRDLCRSLDGLPLALELAAAQMDVLTPAVICTQIRDRRSFAVRPSGPDRQRTLGAATDWSVGLLDDDEHDVLYRLAVFPSCFEFDAAIAIVGNDAATASTTLISLLRNSLVSHDGPASERYRLLDTVRSHLQSTDSDHERRAHTQRRHAEYYADLAAAGFHAVRTADQSVWLTRLRADQPNFRIALDRCFGPDGDERLGARIAGDLAWVWTLTGNLVDARAALERAVLVDADPLVRARVLLGIALIAAPQGDQDRARDACRASAEIGRDVGDDGTVASALLTLGVAQWASGDLVGAACSHDDAIELFDRLRDGWGASICRALRARTAHDVGDLERTRALLDAAVDDAYQTGDAHVIALVHEHYTRLALTNGQNERATRSAEACLAHNELIGYDEGISAALALLARAHLANDDLAAARRLHTRALRHAAKIGHTGAICAALESIAELDADSGEPIVAARSLVAAQRARARRRLPAAQSELRRIDELHHRLRGELEEVWDDLVHEMTLRSLHDVIRELTDPA